MFLHVETCLLIYISNQVTVFYMMETLVLSGLKSLSRSAFTFSKLTIETLEQGVNMLKVNTLF